MTTDDTDHPTPDEATRDELVAAVLDGEATPAELEIVSGDPVLRARLEQFAAVRSILGTDPRPAMAPPVDLAARRRQRNRQLAGTIGAVAATVLITVGGLSLFRSTDTPDVVATGGTPGAANVPAPGGRSGPTGAGTDDGAADEITATAGSADGAVGPGGAPSGPAVEAAPVDCAVAVEDPGGRWRTTGTSACEPLRLPTVSSREVVRIVGELLASGGPLVVTVGVGTGITETVPACPWGRREPLGVVSVTDRASPVVVAVDPFDAVGLFDATTCAPL